ncbi:hypothetical protein RINTHM_12420 [Richelia intracellularis HM01]|nr:hypothetical protein RINTHM_12420 [Richelia intracellularis HM01]
MGMRLLRDSLGRCVTLPWISTTHSLRRELANSQESGVC